MNEIFFVNVEINIEKKVIKAYLISFKYEEKTANKISPRKIGICLHVNSFA